MEIESREYEIKNIRTGEVQYITLQVPKGVSDELVLSIIKPKINKKDVAK